MQRSRLFTVLTVVFLDLLGFGLVIPLLPYYASNYGANEAVQGLLVASYAAAQFIGAPLLGRLSDRFGRRPVLLLSIFGTFLSLLLLGVAQTLLILFISRILDGLTGGNISVAQAYIADVTDEKSRARGLGLIGAAFGLGFIIGPAMGGILSGVGATIDAGADGAPLGLLWAFALPAFVAAGLSFINMLQVYFTLPESLTPERRAEIANQPGTQRRPALSFTQLRAAFQRPNVGSLLHVRFFYGLAFSMLQTVFAIYAAVQLGLDATQTAFVLTYVGVLAVIVQGGLIGWLTSRFGEIELLFSSTIILAVGLLGWAFAPNVPVLLIALIPISYSGGVLNTVINSTLTKAVTPQEVGGILGVSASLESLTRAIAPTVGGVLIAQFGSWSPGVVSAVIMAWVAWFTYRRIVPNPALRNQTAHEGAR